MKVLMLNGSARPDGNTNLALTEAGTQLELEGIEYEIFQLGGDPVLDCIGCNQCAGRGCVFRDDRVHEFVELAEKADGFIFGTPVYYAHPSGRLLSFLDRAFYGSKDAFACKPGAGIAVARRAGTTASLDVLNKYFGVSRMPAAGSTYWNVVHGWEPGEAAADGEGLQTVRNLARYLAWLMKCIAAGKEAGIDPPVPETGSRTNFIR